MAITLTKRYRDKYGPLEATAHYRDDQQEEAEQAAGVQRPPPQRRKMMDLDGDGIPDGAEVQRTVTRQDEDGTQQRDVFKWQHEAPKFEEPGADDALSRRMEVNDRLRYSSLSTGSSVQGRRDAADFARDHRRRMMDVADRRNAFALAANEQQNAGRIAALEGNKGVAVADMNRRGMIGQGRDAARLRGDAAIGVARENRMGTEDTNRTTVTVAELKNKQAPSVFATKDAEGGDVNFVYYNGQIQRVDSNGAQLAGDPLKDQEGNVIGYMGADGKPSYFQTKQIEESNRPLMTGNYGIPGVTPAQPAALAPAAPAPKPPPPVGTVRNGKDGQYRFSGGDPADPKAWSKV